MNKCWFAVLLFFCCTLNTYAYVLTLGDAPLRPDAPETYVIRSGDTLQSILPLYTDYPQVAREMWDDKHLPPIKGGEVVEIIKLNDRPALQFKRGRSVRLTPQVRIIEQERKDTIIPTESIQQFLNRPKVITEQELEQAGRIIGNSEETLLATRDMSIYVVGLSEDLDIGEEFIIARPGHVFRNPEDDEVLAREAIYLGDAKLEARGDIVSTLTISNANREILRDDLLLPLGERRFNEDFRPSQPTLDSVEGGQVLAVVDGMSQIGQYQVVVVNRGENDGLIVGNVLAVERGGNTITDPETYEKVRLPNRRAGTLMVFRVFEQVSYAIVMQASLPIHVLNYISAP